MRVLFYVFFPAGGIGRYTNYLVRAMQEVESFGTEIVCLPEFQWANTKCYPTWPRLWSISHRWSWFRKARFLIAQFVNPRRLFKRVNEIHPEIVHLCNINHLSYPTWERLMVRSNVIVGVSVHDVRRAKAIVNKRWESWQLRRVYRRADALFVHSEAQRDDLLSYAECSHERVHVVPMGSFTSLLRVILKRICGRSTEFPIDLEWRSFSGIYAMIKT